MSVETLTINYGLTLRGTETIKLKIGSLQIEGSREVFLTMNEEGNKLHQRIREKLREEFPGWNISGYCLASMAATKTDAETRGV